MTDKPILFSGPMVRALLEGRKSQTRRVLKPQPETTQSKQFGLRVNVQDYTIDLNKSAFAKVAPSLCATHAIGDRLWLREAHYLTDDGESEYAVFAEDDAGVTEHLENMQTTMSSHPQIDWSKHLRLRPSIHMPRWASRLTLVVTDVRVQRVQEISEADAVAEGSFLGRCQCMPKQNSGDKINRMFNQTWCHKHGDSFHTLWDSLNAKRGFGWDTNPWVAAYTFTVHHCNIDQMEAA